MTMSTPNNSRFPRKSVLRAGQGQLENTDNFLEVVQRLEKAIGSLSRLLTDHAQAIAQMGINGVQSNVPDEVPSVEEISDACKLPRAGVARLLHVMVQFNGDVVPDAKLCALVRCSSQSLKVFACEARGALHDLGFKRGICRERGRGYYMDPLEIESLIALSKAAKSSRGAHR